MVKIYSRENATQRGQQSGALLGSVAAAVRLLARGMITEEVSLGKFAQRSEGSKLGQLQSENGIGWSAVSEVLGGKEVLALAPASTYSSSSYSAGCSNIKSFSAPSVK